MRYRRCITAFLCVIMLFAILLPVSANAPAPSPWFTIELANLPEGTVYVDMLIPLSDADPQYMSLVDKNLPEGFDGQASILNYYEDGFCSYTFHYCDAVSVISPQPEEDYCEPYVLFFTDHSLQNIRYAHMEDIQQRKYIRLAMLDAEGNILKVSQTLSLDSNEFLSVTLGSYFYNAATDTLEVDAYQSGIGVILYLFVSVLGVGLTIVLEWLVALFFRIHSEHSGLVTITNLITQVCMRVVYVLLYSTVFYHYTLAVIVLEIGVYLSEWLIYRKFMYTVSERKCLLYTVAANTVSLVVGLGLMIV